MLVSALKRNKDLKPHYCGSPGQGFGDRQSGFDKEWSFGKFSEWREILAVGHSSGEYTFHCRDHGCHVHGVDRSTSAASEEPIAVSVNRTEQNMDRKERAGTLPPGAPASSPLVTGWGSAYSSYFTDSVKHMTNWTSQVRLLGLQCN